MIKGLICALFVASGVSTTFAKENDQQLSHTQPFEKARSFSCIVSKHDGDLQLSWGEDLPAPAPAPPREGGYYINVITATLPLSKLEGKTHQVAVSEGLPVKVTIDGEDLPVRHATVRDNTVYPAIKRPLSPEELNFVGPIIRRNMIACMKNHYFRVGLDDEL